MLHVGNTGHLDLDRHGDLLLDVLRRTPRPLSDDLDVVVGDVGIGLYRQVMKRDDAPREKQGREAEHQPAVIQRKIDQAPYHRFRLIYWSAEFSSSSALETTCWPGLSPELISCRFPGNMGPPSTATRLNLPSPAGTKTESRSCRCRTAAAGTTVCISAVLPWKVAVTNMPIRIRLSGFST